MNVPSPTKRTAPHARRRAAGFSLIELMIAMVLGLIVIAGVTSVFLAGQQSFRTNNALADVQDSSRVAFELMARDIREAGATGCNLVDYHVTNALNNQTTAWWADWQDNTLRGYADAAVDPALTGLSNANAVAGTSSLQLIGAGANPSVTKDLFNGSNTEIVLANPAEDLSAGDIVMVCTPGRAAIFQAGSYTAATGTLTWSDSGHPGTSPTDLGCPMQPNPAFPADVYCYPVNSLLSKMRAVDWYIGANDEGGRSLYRVSLENTGGAPTPTKQEMVRDVQDMQIAYLNPANDGRFYPASASTIATMGSGWAGVSAVRVTLTMQSAFQRAGTDGNPIERTYSFTTALRNRVN